MSPYTAFDNNHVYWADPSGADSWSGKAAEEVFQELKDYIASKSKENEQEDENDDIRFRDKNGKVIATYYTTETEDDVYLPVEDNTASNVDLNAVLAKYSGIEDLDVVGIGIGGDFTAIMGGGMSYEALYYLDGNNKGEYSFYKTKRQNIGAGGSGGAYGIFGDYLGADESLNFNDYAGISYSIGIDTPLPYLINGVSMFWAPRPGVTDHTSMRSLYNKDLRIWSGNTISLVSPILGGAVQWSRQNTTIYKK